MQTATRRTLARLAAIGLAAATAGICWVALVTAMTMIPSPGVSPGDPGGNVRWVLPGSFAWNDGIRQTQIVVEIRREDAPESWELYTAEGELGWRTAISADVAILRDLVPWALFAAILGLFAIVLAWARRPLGVPLAGAAAVIGTVAFLRLGDVLLSTAGALAGLGIPALGAALLVAPRWRPGAIAITAGAIGIAAAWLIARAQGPVPYGLAEPVRTGGAMAAVGLSIAAISDPDAIRRALLRIDAPRLVDALSLTVAAGVLAGVWIVGGDSLLLVLVAALVLVALYPRWRRTAIRLLDGILVGQVRERASLSATEVERARLARELHDEPLQQLSGLIRRLETRGATEEADEVRDVVARLRTMTSELHPPVLHDLGLGPALESLVPVPGAGPAVVTLAVDDHLEPAGERLPADVEVAAYRIVQEAVRNAVRHAGATLITIGGRLEPGSLLLRVVDDGSGLDERRVRAAEREGHFGVGLMRQRAGAIGAHLAIRGGQGTVVELTWRAGER